MRALPLLPLLLPLLTSCATCPVHPAPEDGCAWPDPGDPPALHPVPTPDGHVALSVPETNALSTWMARAREERIALRGCSHLKVTP